MAKRGKIWLWVITALAFIGSFSISCVTSHATSLSGSAWASVSNINFTFSDINAIEVNRKGVSKELSFADTYVFDYETGQEKSQISREGASKSKLDKLYAESRLVYDNISSFAMSNNLYDGVSYGAFVNGQSEQGSMIRSSAYVVDDWDFTVTAPLKLNISYDYEMWSSGEISNSLGKLWSESTIFLDLGRNNWHYPSAKTVWMEGLETGTFSREISYLPGDHGSISFAVISGLASRQDSAPAPVPEPATILLLGAGLMGAGVLRRKGWK